MAESSFMKAMLRSRCAFSITLAASATFIDGALCSPAVTTEPYNRRDDVESACILTSHDLCDRLEPMSPVARIDSLGRIAHAEIATGRQTRDLFEDWHAIFLRRAGIHSRLVDDDVALLQSLTHRRRGTQQCRQVWSPRLIDGGRYRHDEEIRGREFARIGREDESGMGQIMRLDLARAVVAGLEFADACSVDIEADHRRALSAERDKRPAARHIQDR